MDRIAEPRARRESRPIAKSLSAVVIALALATGVGLRLIRLHDVPAGFHQDEACEGYDAYSLLTTGRDHHGNFLPLALQAFNQFAMPLFGYSLIPLIGAFGLAPSVVRFGAALWGSVDLVAIALLGGLVLGWPGAAAAAVLGALSPWHLTISRYGVEDISSSATVTLAMLCFFLWLRRRTDRWLWLSAAMFGLTFYSYAITKAFTPFMVGLLGLFYWRELVRVWRSALAALAIVVLLGAPQALLVLRHPEMQAEFHVLNIFNFMSECPDCEGGPGTANSSLLPRLANFGANWIAYFTPSFLFVDGDRGDRATLLHPPGFGQLLPEQAVLLTLALAALLSARRRKTAVFLLGWLMLATLPAALTLPLGAYAPDTHNPPVPWGLLSHPVHNVPLTPALLLAHPDSRHDLLAMGPWILLSALGLVVMLDLTRRTPALGTAAAGLLLAGVLYHGAGFVRAYFVAYPVIAAPYFQYGMEEVVQDLDRFDHGGIPVVITDRVNLAYIYVLFFGHYPPSRFQHQRVYYSRAGLDAPVVAFDHYLFLDPQFAWGKLKHGIFVYPGIEALPAPATATVRYPDGRLAFSIIVK